jgi:O-antigen/teichoic acid export membrane protein
MSVTRRIAFGAAAHWVSRGVTIFLGLVLMPVLIRNLPREEVGLWLLLGQSWAVMGILDLGFGATLIRRIALAKGKSGGDVTTVLNETSLSEIADLVASSRRIYRWMAFAVFLISLGSGFYYLANLELKEVRLEMVWVAWSIICASQALMVWQTPWACLLQGMGYVGWEALLVAMTNGGTLVAQITVVMFGGGIVSLAVLATVGIVIQRILLMWMMRKRNPEFFILQGKWNPAVMKGMPGLAFRTWISSLGSVLVLNTDSFFIASMEGAENIPAYRAAYLIALNLHIMAGVFVQSASVFTSQLWQAGNLPEVHRIFQRNLRIGFCLIACCGSAVFFAGKSLFDLWLGPGNYVGETVVFLLLLVFFLEQQSFIILHSCRATDSEPFAFWMLVGGLLKLVLAAVLVRWIGLLGLALATLLCQVPTSYPWIWRLGLKRLQYPLSRYSRGVLLPCGSVLLVAIMGGWLSQWLTSGLGEVWQLLVVSFSSAVVWAVALWTLVMEQNQRQRLLAWLFSRVG